MMSLRSLGQLVLLTAVIATPAAQDQPFRLVPRKAEPPPATIALPWSATFAEAQAAAKQRHTKLLLFFTAKWCRTSKYVEHDTFPDPEVGKELAALALARIDVDAPSNLAVCRRHHGHEGLPTFVLFTENGEEWHRWAGFSDVAAFLRHLRQEHADTVRESTDELDEHAARAEFWLRRNDHPGVTTQLKEIEKLDPARTSKTLDSVLWACCTAAKGRRDWPALHAAAQRYTGLPTPSHFEQGQLLLGIAEFELSGTVGQALQQYIDARIAILDSPVPGTSVRERMEKLLGNAEPAGDAVGQWVERANATMHELTDVGRAAAPGLRTALLAKPGARQAAVVLARMRLPETTPWLIERLGDAATPAWAQSQLVYCVALHEEERCLPTLLEFLGPKHPAPVRAKAADGIKQIAWLTDGTTRQDVADAMALALESRDLGLRAEVLQALFEVHAPMPLDLLLEVLDDRRGLGWGGYRVCDNTLWMVSKQLGMQLERVDGTPLESHCTPEIAAWLRGWHAEHRASLRWDLDARHYRIDPK